MKTISFIFIFFLCTSFKVLSTEKLAECISTTDKNKYFLYVNLKNKKVCYSYPSEFSYVLNRVCNITSNEKFFSNRIEFRSLLDGINILISTRNPNLKYYQKRCA